LSDRGGNDVKHHEQRTKQLDEFGPHFADVGRWNLQGKVST
jgi:hypothetical protein